MKPQGRFPCGREWGSGGANGSDARRHRAARDLVACVDRVTEALVDCVDRAQVPAQAVYPAVCNPCESGSPAVCSGLCPTGSICTTVPGPPPFFDPPACGCAPDGSQPSASSSLILCNGTCPSGEQCGSLGIDGLSQCGCGNPPCGDAVYPTCGGDCLAGQVAAPLEVQKRFGQQLAHLLRDLRHPSLRAKKYNESSGLWQARINDN